MAEHHYFPFNILQLKFIITTNVAELTDCDTDQIMNKVYLHSPNYVEFVLLQL